MIPRVQPCYGNGGLNILRQQRPGQPGGWRQPGDDRSSRGHPHCIGNCTGWLLSYALLLLRARSMHYENLSHNG
jgi:hypothetical protein